MKTSILLAAGVLLFAHPAIATILWMGGEDVDFPNGANICVQTWSADFRGNYAREAVSPCACNSISVSTPFSGGAVTTAWLSAQLAYSGDSPRWGYYALIGLGNTAGASSLWVGFDYTNWSKLALWTFDGTNWAELASEGGVSLSSSGQYKIDMSVTSYGASATVNVYLNGGNPKISYTGNVLAGSGTNLNAVVMNTYNCNNSNWLPWFSEVIVATTDTRSLSLATLAPAAAGDTNQWSGDYTDVNATTINDAVNVSDSTSGDIFECKLNSLPSGIGNVSIAAVKVIARGTTSGGGIASLKVGVKTNSTVSTPAAVTQTGSYFPTETYYSTNPVTSSAWTAVDLNALQITLKSAP